MVMLLADKLRGYSKANEDLHDTVNTFNFIITHFLPRIFIIALDFDYLQILRYNELFAWIVAIIFYIERFFL
jgi:hypothetical protein